MKNCWGLVGSHRLGRRSPTSSFPMQAQKSISPLKKDNIKELVRNIDFDFWCNAKRDIVLVIDKAKSVSSVAELSRLIKKSYSVTYRHVVDLEEAGYLQVVEDGFCLVEGALDKWA